MKRIIFTLLYSNEKFYLSRNFRLQEIGDLDWLFSNYKFQSITENIDELIILNLEKHKIFLKNLYPLYKKLLIIALHL